MKTFQEDEHHDIQSYDILIISLLYKRLTLKTTRNSLTLIDYGREKQYKSNFI